MPWPMGTARRHARALMEQELAKSIVKSGGPTCGTSFFILFYFGEKSHFDSDIV